MRYTIEGKKKTEGAVFEWIYNGQALVNEYEVWDIIRKEVKSQAWRTLVIAKYSHPGVHTWRIEAQDD